MLGCIVDCKETQNKNIYIFLEKNDVADSTEKYISGVIVRNNSSSLEPINSLTINNLEFKVNKGIHQENKLEEIVDDNLMKISINSHSHDIVSKTGTYTNENKIGKLSIINSANGMKSHEALVYAQLVQIKRDYNLR